MKPSRRAQDRGPGGSRQKAESRRQKAEGSRQNAVIGTLPTAYCLLPSVRSYCRLPSGPLPPASGQLPPVLCRLPSAFCFLSLHGQALIEFAIVGSVALLALAVMIQMGLRQNFQQDIEQTAFRRALLISKSEEGEESQAVQYNFFRDREMPNPSQGFAILPRTMTQAGATATWGEWLTYLDDSRDSQPRVIVQLNNTVRQFRSEDFKEDVPLISAIDKAMVSTGSLEQDNAGSHLRGSTAETTRLTLNTKNNAFVNNDEPITSTLSKDVSADWELE